MILLVISGMGKYTAYSSSTNLEIFNDMPSSIKAILGFGSFEITTIGGFFAFLFSYIELAASIHAVLLGSSILAKEERDKTSEFLMVKPVSRREIITAKLLAVLINILVINVVTFLASIIMVGVYNKGESITNEIVQFFLSMLVIQFIFMSFGMLLSTLIKRSKAAGSLSSGILFGTFVISKITDMSKHLVGLNLFSPFKYFNPVDIVNGIGLNYIIIVVTILLAGGFLFASYHFYLRRDLSI